MSKDTREKVLESAIRLFARYGFEGVSVRQICADAGASANAVHYHFGSKKALYQTVLRRYVDRYISTMSRIVGEGPADPADLRLRLRLFVEETIITLLEDVDLLRIVYMELAQDWGRAGVEIADTFSEQAKVLTRFLDMAKERELIREGVDTAIVAGMLRERTSYQVRYAEVFEKRWGESVLDPDYRRHWIDQTIDTCLFGISADVSSSDVTEGDSVAEYA